MSTDKKAAPIGLIAGNRRLPFMFADWAKRNGRDLYIAGIKGETDPKLRDEVGPSYYHDFYITNLSQIANYFKSNGVHEIVMIGGIACAKLRPSLDVLVVALRLAFMKNKHKGIFTIILSMFNSKGVRVRSIQELMPELLIGEGPLGSVAPSDEDIAAFRKNWGTMLEYIRTGDGQAVIIYKGEILAFENFKGTDDLVKRATEKRRAMGAGSGGIMAKIMEPGQDERADLPVVGTGTVETLAKYGINGVIIEAGRTIADDVKETVALADKLGVFVYGIKI
ncbi:MAG: UDP-2,3-diacylglucosamine diphosphatase LpxI [Chitinispirillia bacterium]|nr:UDP-2,3-diacylglucosamine diphosphatase LpxI [Chitinispirillia bacterium]MCL2268409.1 UDP-2,3-diacylglucosamine diphosphatase LpxI [Chitinispirillia bacterium]